MSLVTIEQDLVSGLSLLKDASDPPRFYVQRRRRRELIAIGDESLARSRFAAWRGRILETGARVAMRTPAGSPALTADPVNPLPLKEFEVSF